MEIIFDSNKFFYKTGEKVTGKIYIKNKTIKSFPEISKFSLFLRKDEYWFEKDKGYNSYKLYVLKPHFGFIYPDIILFCFDIPYDLIPNFEYSNKIFSFYIRYYVEVNCEINDVSYSENKLLIILPKIIHESKIIKEHSNMISVFLNKNNFHFNDKIKLLIEFENKSMFDYKGVKIDFKRKIYYNNKKDFINETIMKKKYDFQVKKNEKNILRYSLILNEENFCNINFLLPSINSSLISCKYCIKISFYYESNSIYYYGETIEIPIIINYDIQKDYLMEDKNKDKEKGKYDFDIQNEIIFNPNDSMFLSEDDFSIINNNRI